MTTDEAVLQKVNLIVTKYAHAGATDAKMETAFLLAVLVKKLLEDKPTQ